MMDFWIVKIEENGVVAEQPIIAVGDKLDLSTKLKTKYGDDVKITFSPNKYSFDALYISERPEGLYPFNELIWDPK